MSVFTFGLYGIYWCYKNWRRIRERSGERLSPFWRAFFTALWSFSLFKRIRQHALEQNVTVTWSAGLRGTLYFLLVGLSRLPDPLWLVSWAAFIPFISVVQTTHEINAGVSSAEDVNASYSSANIVVIVIGGLSLVLAAIEVFQG